MKSRMIRARLFSFRIGEFRFLVERHRWEYVKPIGLSDEKIKLLVRQNFPFHSYRLSTIGSDGRPVVVLFQKRKKTGKLKGSQTITQKRLLQINRERMRKSK